MFRKLLNFVQQRSSTGNQAASEASLLIQLRQSQKDNLQKFQVEAWLIPDLAQYDYEKTQGYDSLDISNDIEQTFTLQEVPALISNCLNQAAGHPYAVTDPRLEVFLPLAQLNEVVEDWNLVCDSLFADSELDDDPFADPEPELDPLGWRYRVVFTLNRPSELQLRKEETSICGGLEAEMGKGRG